MKRTRVEVIKTINSNINDVWESVANPTDIVNWSSMISNAEIDGEVKVGATRTCTMGEDVFNEFIETLDHELKIFQYSIPEPPFPVENVLGTIQLKEKTDIETEVTWALNFSVAPEMEEDISNAIKEIYIDGIAGLEKQNELVA